MSIMTKIPFKQPLVCDAFKNCEGLSHGGDMHQQQQLQQEQQQQQQQQDGDLKIDNCPETFYIGEKISKGAAEAFIKAAEIFEANNDGEAFIKAAEIFEANKEALDFDNSPDIFYVGKKMLEELNEKLNKTEEISAGNVMALTSPDFLAADEIMVPVDMRQVGKEFEDVQHMVEKLGPKGTAEAFIKAAEYLEANKDREPDEDHPMPMTAQEVRRFLDEVHCPKIWYVGKKLFENLRKKLKKKKVISEGSVLALCSPESLKADEIMVPVDLRKIGKDFEDVEQMIEKLGPQGAAEAIIKAAKFFEANKDGEPVQERPKPLTAFEWKRMQTSL